jgi:tetratricopeptide (TPR) repeat protein
VGRAGHLPATAPAPPDESTRAWLALRGGQAAEAEQGFARALLAEPRDARALFGAASLAYERGDGERAWQSSLALLELAAREADPLAHQLAAATLARIARVLTELPDRRAAEDRLLALDGSRLSWQAHYALALVVFDIARRRGDSALLGRAMADAGCVSGATLVGRSGRLPFLDLDAEGYLPEPEPRSLLRAGCQLQLNLPDALPGVKVLQANVELPGGRYAVVLDFAGPARLRVDGGPWQAHGGSLSSYGARWSATVVQLAGREHHIELRIGSYGQGVDLALLVMPVLDTPPDSVSASSANPNAAAARSLLLTYASALEANLVGDTDRLLTQIDKLDGEGNFALGLAAAARLAQSDATRPADIMRDKARELFGRALAIDPGMARAWLDLAGLEMQKSRPRDAAAAARHALAVAPAWWPGHLALATALRAQGFERPADDEIDAGMKLLDEGKGGCSLIAQALDRAEERDHETRAAYLVDLLSRCDAQSDAPRLWLSKHGDLPGVKAWLEQAMPLSSDPVWLRSERAEVALALGSTAAASAELADLARLAPRDVNLRIRLADVELAEGGADRARTVLAQALALYPGRQEVRQAARLVGLALPLDEYRVDGRSVIRDYLASGRHYPAPAVVVLDRAVEKALPDGAGIVLTHSITQVLSKDAIEHVGEVTVPEGAEILALRTHKADGTVREAEEIAGKGAISAPNLAVGDFVEVETLEFKEARAAVAPGFVAERFYFQSFDAPLDRSEYVLIAPAGAELKINTRGQAPPPVTSRAHDGTQVLTFSARGVAQAFAERSAVPAQEWIPSVKVSSGLSVLAWSRFIADGFVRAGRGSPEVDKIAALIARQAGGHAGHLAADIVSWVGEHIEPEDDFAESATATLARGRGNRAALLLALARSLGVRADLLLARSLLAAPAEAPVGPDDLDDFREALVSFAGPGGDLFVDPQLRRAPLGYLPPYLDGTRALVAGSAQLATLRSQVRDSRKVELRAELQSDGSAQVAVVEKVTGWPVVEWNELLDVTGQDQATLRREFEQRWLGQQFPGAQLDTLSVKADRESTRVEYTFRLAGMATPRGPLLVLRPSFFQSQPGRRFGSEPERKTALMLGFDVPVELQADITLPPGAKVVELGRGSEVKIGDAVFVEERSSSELPDGRTKLSLMRKSCLPLMRIAPQRYSDVAAQLRAVDSVEQGEMRIALAGD